MAQTGFTFLDDHPDMAFDVPIIITDAETKAEAEQAARRKASGPITYDGTIEVPDLNDR